MDLQLKGKAALVTGASSGLGAATAIELAREGVDVVVHGRDRARAEATALEARALGVKAVAVTGDLMKDEDADRVAEEALAALGRIDILVNNAGAVLRMDNPPWHDVTPADWLASYNLNVGAAVRLCLKLVPPMMERGWGRVINISSTAGHVIRGRLVDYGAAKAGLNNFTSNLAKQTAKKGVTVNSIIPGTFLTPAVERWLETLKKQQGWGDDMDENERLYVEKFNPQPVPRLGRPREIATAVTFIASPLTGYINGAFLRVDGGVTDSVGAG